MRADTAALRAAIARLALEAKNGTNEALEDALAAVIAHGRLTAEALQLDRPRMTKLVNKILGEAML